DREIWSAIAAAQRRASGLEDVGDGPGWSPVDEILHKQVLRDYSVSEQELKALAPAPAPTTAYLRQLYRETDLICLGRTATNFQTLPLGLIIENVPDLSDHEFINPSPMSALSGLTGEGGWSAHTKNNTGPRVYGVVEFDGGTPLEHAAILRYLG